MKNGYRPYKTAKEMLQDYTGRLMTFTGMWIEDRRGIYMVTAIRDDRVCVSDHWVRFDTLLNEYNYVDGTPCGMPEEERNANAS